MAALLYASSVQAEAQKAQQDALARYGGEVVSVCVATRDIEPGDVVDESCIAMEEWLASLCFPRARRRRWTTCWGKPSSPASRNHLQAPPISRRTRTPSRFLRARSPCPFQAIPSTQSEGLWCETRLSMSMYRGTLIADRLVRARVLDTSSLATNGGGDISWVTLAVDPASVKELLAATTQGALTDVVVPGDLEQDEQGGAA